MSPLFLDYVTDWSRVQKFYGPAYTLESIMAFGRKRAGETLPHREALCHYLREQLHCWEGDSASAASIDKLANGAVAVVTGQQPGLFTGPNYTILKAITAIKLARALNDSGLPAVPVFWVAAEDHDNEEIRWTSIMDRDSAVRRFQVNLANDDASPVGWLQFGEDVPSVIGELLSSLPQSEFQAELRTVLENAYKPGASPVDSFARMMTRLFRDTGLILVDPLRPGLKAIAVPVLNQVVERNAQLRTAVLERSRAISDAGYHEQVKVDGNFTGLFAFHGKSRQSLKPDSVRGDDVLSPNVLVRGVVQDTIFPTAAFIAGPAEVAYFAQAAAVYRTLGREVTPVYPRISATILEARVSKALRKFDLEFSDVFQGREFLKRRAVGSIQSVDLFAKVKQSVGESMESLRAMLNAVDPTLVGALETSRQKMVYQVETLETKFVNAEARRNEVMEKQLELIGNSIFPEKKLQERVLNIATFAARYGIGFVKWLEAALSLDSTQHQIIEI